MGELKRAFSTEGWANAPEGSLLWLAAHPEELERRLQATRARLAAENSPRRDDVCKYGCGGAGWFKLGDVPVGHPNFGKVVPCQCAKDRMMQTDAQRAAQYEAQLSRTERAYTLKNWIGDDKAAQDAAFRIVKHPFGLKLFIGKYGVGKTSLLAAMYNTLGAQRMNVHFEKVDTLLSRLQAVQARGVDALEMEKQKLYTVRALFLDEWSAYAATEWKDNLLRAIIDERYRRWNELLTVIGSNEMPTSDAIESRLHDKRACEIVSVEGRDLRPIAHELQNDGDFWWTHEIADALGAASDERARTAAAIR